MRSLLSALFVPFDIEGCSAAFHSFPVMHQGCNPLGTGIIGPKQMWERACPAKRRAGGAQSHRRQISTAKHFNSQSPNPGQRSRLLRRLPQNHGHRSKTVPIMLNELDSRLSGNLQTKLPKDLVQSLLAFYLADVMHIKMHQPCQHHRITFRGEALGSI